MKKDFVMPILVLSLICLVISGALAVTNEVTQPVIAEAAAQRAEQARRDIIPDADAFEMVTSDGLPATVKEVYRATNGVGYIFMLTTGGYGGDIELIAGIGPDGKIIRCSTLEHSETKGMGSKVTEPAFESQFENKDAMLEGVSAISGATISSTAYMNAIKDAFTAFEIVKGVK